MQLSHLLAICSENGLDISRDEANLLSRYAELLVEWNAKINLISRKDESNILERHILHSLTLRMPNVCAFELAGNRIADLGSGGGLPGIPIKIVTPSAHVSLIDSIQKKISACTEMIASMKLQGIEAVRGRAEERGREPKYRHAFDAVISRAAAPMDDLAKWSKSLLKPNGTIIALKGGDLTMELTATQKLKFVKNIDVKPLELIGYDGFAIEGKKIVTVTL